MRANPQIIRQNWGRNPTGPVDEGAAWAKRLLLQYRRRCDPLGDRLMIEMTDIFAQDEILKQGRRAFAGLEAIPADSLAWARLLDCLPRVCC